ncbi:hypothetical protein GCM10010994_25140 [Chelatococcus reniformis]|uniref:IclR family transcriptional regulator n=1 Tax=Chelatococcus reniformis TaxID=1494448 RepID=A0A916UA63_9HYPH|nr:hypothetical protein GCM10010994_25140 [Chelatococcus reniformis]
MFELFSEQQRPLSVGEISRHLSIPQPSASMLLRNLRALGYLDYDETGRRYSPTLRLPFLVSWISRRFDRVGLMMPLLERLFRQVGDTVFVGMQNRASAQYILVMKPEQPAMLITSGMHRSLTVSAMGAMLLSLKPDEEIRRWVARCNAEADDPRVQVRTSEYLDRIATIRTNRYAETAGEITPGVGAIAIAIACPLNGTPLAVGVGGTVERLARDRPAIVRALRAIEAHFAAEQGLPHEVNADHGMAAERSARRALFGHRPGALAEQMRPLDRPGVAAR